MVGREQNRYLDPQIQYLLPRSITWMFCGPNLSVLYFIFCFLLMRLPRTCTSDLYLKREPMRMNPERAEFFWTGPLSLKKAWCSTAHFHRCLQALGWSILKTKVCSCSFPCGWRRRRCRSERNVIACSSRPPPDGRLRQRNQRAAKEVLTGFNICLSSRIDRHIVKTEDLTSSQKP